MLYFGGGLMSTVYDSYTTGDDEASAIRLDFWAAQTFTTNITYRCTGVSLKLYKDDTLVPGTITIKLKATDGDNKPTGDALATGTTNANTLTIDTDGEWRDITFVSPVVISRNTVYAILWWRHDETDPTYTGGSKFWSDDEAAWTAEATKDLMFKTLGDVAYPTDKTYSKKLVAVANNEVWYEDVVGSMNELEADNIKFETAFPLSLFEAFKKVILINKTAKGDLLTQTTSGAKMIVDFVDSTKRYIYGYTTTATVFTTTAGHTLVSGDETATMDPNPAPKPDVVSEASTTPHWYDYTNYPDIILSIATYGLAIGATKSFGSLPAKATLGCLYRGRVVLGGNPNYPHQWYMSRQADIWDYAYLASDAQSPVAGNNTDAGELGDILTALIPYKDDYLVFGCASTIWVLRGDPAAGGSLDEVDLTVGIYGAKSWCFDGDGNLYFWGTNGIYVMPAGFGAVKCLTENTLPNIINDEDVNPLTHRITMGYDRKRRGILTCITILETGVNSNYWYDLRTGGFFPESYPDVCGPYSLFHYAANDPDYVDLLIGCRDGYIRKFLDTAKGDDDGVEDDTPINSYCCLPIQPLAPDGDHEGKLTSLTVTNAGGAVGGTEGDTDRVDYKLYVADDAETCLEKMKAITDWATGQNYLIGDLVIYLTIEYRCIVAHLSETGGDTHEEPDTNIIDWEPVVRESGTLSGVGRKERLRHRLRGAYLGIKLGNSTADESWAIEAVAGEIVPAGKLK